ncbi:MAG: Phosphoribosyl-dephospho-CoA transferase [Desulfovibrio sp.]
MEVERHDLLHLSLAGRERIFAELASKGFAEDAVGEMLLEGAIPGIVRREEFSPREGFIPVGFSSWRTNENGRFRVASFAKEEEILAVVKPEEVAAKLPARGRAAVKTQALKALAALQDMWDYPLALGVWGSAALELETGRAYTHRWSDLDVRLAPQGGIGRETLERCLATLLEKEISFGIRIDAELRLANSYGISLKELLNESVTVLGKGCEDVILIQKTDVFEGLAAPESVSGSVTTV